jgi:hypothetical protein
VVTTRATVPPRAAKEPATPVATSRLTVRDGWPAMLVGSLVLAVISLFVLPRVVAYDPWSWLIWGREITHLDLNTTLAATAVKPLPIFVDTLLAPTGSLAPILWLLIARWATLLALVLVFRLGRRLGGAGAGLIAAIGLAVSDEFLGYLFMAGMSEPMATAAVLAAVDNHMQSRRRWAFGCLIIAGLLRPEAWPFLILYSLWLAYPKLTRRGALGIVVAVAVPPSWFVIDWFGSRQFFRSAGAATHETQGGPLLSREPGLATVRETWHLMSAPVVVLFVLGLAAALIAWQRSGRLKEPGARSGRLKEPGAVVWFGLGAIGWLAVDAVLAQGRFATGAPRYLLPGVALAAVVAGVFFADAVRALVRILPDSRVSVAIAVLACLGLAVCAGPRFIQTGKQVRSGVRQGRISAQLQTALPRAITLAGGPDAVIACAPIITKNFQVPLLAWQLHVPLDAVHFVPAGEGIVIQDERSPRIVPALSSDYRYLGTVGPPNARWSVLTSCPESK